MNGMRPNTFKRDINLIFSTTKLDHLHYKIVSFDFTIDIMQMITWLQKYELFPAT